MRRCFAFVGKFAESDGDKMIKVSICIPTYNNINDIKRLLSSIFSQEFTDYEVIITDDSTNCKIEEYVADFGEKIRYYHNEKSLGHIYNWNKAISYAKGELIKIMFSDDWFSESTSLGKMVDLLEKNPNAVLAFSGNKQVTLKGNQQQISKDENHKNNDNIENQIVSTYDRFADWEYIENLENDYRYLFISNKIGAPSNTLYRKSTGAIFDEKSNWASDVFLYFEILKKNPQFVHTREPLISIGIHENQYTEMFRKKDPRIFADYKYMFQRYVLIKSEACKEHFLRQYLLPYHKSSKEAIRCGYGYFEYTGKWLAFMWEDIVCSYAKAACKKLVGKKINK